MKSLYIIVSLINLFYLSCKDDKKVQEIQSSTITQKDPIFQRQDTLEIPVFTDPEVQEYVNGYSTYINEYLMVAESKDMTKLGILGLKSQEWKEKGKGVAKKLSINPEELKKYNEHILKLYNKMQQVTSPQ